LTCSEFDSAPPTRRLRRQPVDDRHPPFVSKMKAFISTTAQAKSPSDVASLNTAGWSMAGAVLVLYVLIAIAVMAPLGSRALRLGAAIPRPHRSAMVRMLLFFTAALVMVWTPFDFWSYLPHVFSYVQFSYRLLMFVVLW